MSDSSVCFIIYGIGRGLQHTEDPINQMISSVSEEHQVKVYYYINNQSHIDNERTKERGALPKIPKNVFLGAEKVLISPELKSYKSVLNTMKQYKDAHNDSHKSYHNLLLQLRLLRFASAKINLDSFDYIVCLRDDILFENPQLYWNKIFKVVDNNNLFTTFYGWNNGISDRFFISNPTVAMIILNRIEKIQEFLESYGYITGEQLLFYITRKFKISIVSSRIKISRVRFDGRVHNERHIIPFWRPSEFLRVLKSIFKFYF